MFSDLYLYLQAQKIPPTPLKESLGGDSEQRRQKLLNEIESLQGGAINDPRDIIKFKPVQISWNDDWGMHHKDEQGRIVDGDPNSNSCVEENFVARENNRLRVSGVENCDRTAVMSVLVITLANGEKEIIVTGSIGHNFVQSPKY